MNTLYNAERDLVNYRIVYYVQHNQTRETLESKETELKRMIW